MKISSQPSSTVTPVLQFSLVLTTLLLAVFLTPRPFLSVFNPTERQIILSDSDSLIAYLLDHLGSLSEIRKNDLTPDFLVVNLPDDLSALPAKERSPLFITMVLSHAHSSNRAILLQRKKLILYLLEEKAGKPISPDRKNWFRDLAARYRVPTATPDTLLGRVDIIPASLILAQAITESGWGTSRFAQQGNSLYGQHLAKNSEGKFIISLYGNVKVAAFDSISEATRSYIHNINTAKPYKDFRTIRSRLRSRQHMLSGHSLAQGLRYYSELGDEYIADLRYLIRKYELDRLDTTPPPQYTPVKRIRFSRLEKATLTRISDDFFVIVNL